MIMTFLIDVDVAPTHMYMTQEIKRYYFSLYAFKCVLRLLEDLTNHNSTNELTVYLAFVNILWAT